MSDFIIQDRVSGSSLHTPHRHLWRSWISFCASVDTSFHMSIFWHPIHSSIKVITITGLIILGIVLDLGGKFNLTYTRINLTLVYFTGGPSHDRIGFRYWLNPGPFVQFDGIAGAKGRFLGFWAVLTQAAFSFIGTEIFAVSTFRIPLWSTSVPLYLY